MEEQNRRNSHTATQELVKISNPQSSALVGPYVPPEGYGFGYGEIEGEGEVHLREYWRAIRKRIWMVIGLTLLSGMLATVYVARKPNIYQAQARVQVNLENSSPTGNNTKSAAVVVNNQANDPAYFNTQLQILVSNGLIRRVVRTLDLEHNPEFLNANASQKRSTWQSVLQTLGVN